MRELQKADPPERRKAIIVLILGSVLILAAISQLDTLRGWLTEDPSQAYLRFRYVAAALSLALALPMVWFTLYLWRLAARIRQAGQFPLPGMHVVRDTVIVRGPSAQRRALLLQLLSTLLMLSTVGFIAVLWWFTAILPR